MQHHFPEYTLIVPRKQKDRLQTTCFRGERKAGCFIHWRSVEDVIMDPKIYHEFNRHIEGILNEPGFAPGAFSFTIELDCPVGWGSTASLAEIGDLSTEIKPLNRRATAVFVTDPRFKARLTNLITFITSIDEDVDHPGEMVVLLQSLYPGVDVGELKGNVSAREGLVFLDWNQKGQSAPHSGY